ncbi:MAG: hypothetical protein AB1894_00250 [Chloroflexota bacterium]
MSLSPGVIKMLNDLPPESQGAVEKKVSRSFQNSGRLVCALHGPGRVEWFEFRRGPDERVVRRAVLPDWADPPLRMGAGGVNCRPE